MNSKSCESITPTLLETVPQSFFVIASDPAMAGERGNPIDFIFL
jgi:hypothetical protein